DIYPIFLDYRPPAIFLRKIRRSFIHHHGRTGSERPIDRITVTRHPANIRGAPVDIVLFQIEYPLHCSQGMSEISADSMDDSFCFAVCSGSRERVQSRLGVQAGRLAVAAFPRHCVMPPEVAPFQDADGVAGTTHNQAFSHRWATL